MEKGLILIDSSVLIYYYRKTNKEKTHLARIIETDYIMAVSVITQFEVYVGTKPDNKPFWDNLFESITILPLDSSIINTALMINESLKKQSKQIAFPDLLIASTAVYHQIPLITLNQKHFNRIDNLVLTNI